MKKVISYSLWGDEPKYTIGAVKNAELAPYIYTGWDVWFYIAESVPTAIVNELEKTSKIIHRQHGNWDSMLWRFEPISDASVDIFISRDTDSRLNYRERRAVDEWLESDKSLHIMRDHAYHGTQILGGMWGFRGTINNNVSELVSTFLLNRGKSNHYDIDQRFLREVLVPKFAQDVLVHDEMFKGQNYPTTRINNEYVGAPYNEHNDLEIEFRGTQA